MFLLDPPPNLQYTLLLQIPLNWGKGLDRTKFITGRLFWLGSG